MAFITIQTTSSPFPQTRFEGLLEHGADVTSGDECGLSCIERGMHDVEIYALVLKSVANVPSHYKSLLLRGGILTDLKDFSNRGQTLHGSCDTVENS